MDGSSFSRDFSREKGKCLRGEDEKGFFDQ